MRSRHISAETCPECIVPLARVLFRRCKTVKHSREKAMHRQRFRTIRVRIHLTELVGTPGRCCRNDKKCQYMFKYLVHFPYLELKFHIKADVPCARKHERIKSLIVIRCHVSGKFRVKRSFAVNHPKILAHKSDSHAELVLEPA